MTTKRAHYLITKFLSDKLTEPERQQLEQLLQDPDNQVLFKKVVQANFASDYNLRQFSSESLQRELRKKMKQEKNPFYRRRFSSFIKYAAVLLVLIGTAYYIKDTLFLSSDQEKNGIAPNEEFITLELDNGEIQKIRANDSKIIRDKTGNTIGQQQKGAITYTNANTATESLVYNTLNVPYGKRFNVILSDGTRVYMNSGSSLRYPITFLKGLKREVTLSGEAFFDVAHDTEHPFIVNAETMDVSVLGTEFVISTYPEDDFTGVVLLKGSVALSAESDSKNEEGLLLQPGYRGAMNKATGTIEKTKVNTGIYTAWIQGNLVFRNMSFKMITKKLERYYDVKIINNSNALANEVFNANFYEEPIEIILSYFKDSYDMNYTIEDNTIYIN